LQVTKKVTLKAEAFSDAY